jgi:hypothetical protein
LHLISIKLTKRSGLMAASFAVKISEAITRNVIKNKVKLRYQKKIPESTTETQSQSLRRKKARLILLKVWLKVTS